MASVFRGIIEFFDKLGVYDVILPFLLVFTIVFAILEKTRVLGVQEINGKKYAKKNLNSIVAFCIGFFVIASTKLVAVINEALANMVLLLLLSVSFLILIGSFMKESDESVYLEEPWKTIFTIIMFIGILLIFLNALGWLDIMWVFILQHWNGPAVGSVILLGIIIGFMYLITKAPSEKNGKE